MVETLLRANLLILSCSLSQKLAISGRKNIDWRYFRNKLKKRNILGTIFFFLKKGNFLWIKLVDLPASPSFV